MIKPDKHMQICEELNQLYCNKSSDYGNSVHETFLEEGWAAYRVRLSDKLNRFRVLSHGVIQKVDDETIRDTLMDLANYAILAVMDLDTSKEEEQI